VGVNLFVIKFTPILYLTQIVIALYFYRENKFFSIYVFVFVLGLLDDCVYSRILGFSGIFNVLYLNVLSFFISKFNKNLAKYLILNLGLFVYFLYQLLSLIYLRDKSYIALLFTGDVILLQVFAFLGVFFFQSVLYLKRDFKNNVQRRFGRISRV
jgi:hypothetical protein